MKQALVQCFLLLAVAAAVFWSGCSDDNGPVYCGDGTPDPAIENIWPNEDGTYWTYRIRVRTWGDLDGPAVCDSFYESAEEVPPVPTLDEIEDLLAHHDIGEDPEVELATYDLEFAGDSTTSRGVVGQNLRETSSLDTGGLESRGRMPARMDPLLARIYAARPDLRAAIEARLPVTDAAAGEADLDVCASAVGCFGPECPILIHGGVWRKTDQFVGTYGDLDTLLAWKFLDADLSTGHESVFQLIPALASDVFLHCRVTGLTRAVTEKCIYRKALECVYLIDYGAREVSDIHGPVGFCRSFDYGRVLYVPDVGPVYCYERMLLSTGEPLGPGLGDRIARLIDTGVRAGTR